MHYEWYKLVYYCILIYMLNAVKKVISLMKGI
jgi:hypothetical protein